MRRILLPFMVFAAGLSMALMPSAAAAQVARATMLRAQAAPVNAGTRAQLRALSRSLPTQNLDAGSAAGLVRQAGSDGRLDLGDMSIEDAVMMMFALISEDASADTKAMLEQMNQTREKKAALRAASTRMKQDQSGLRDAMTAPRQDAGTPVLATSASVRTLDAAKDAAQDDKDSLSDMGEMEQLRLQALMDRRAKAEEMLSNMMKKSSDTQNAIIGNMK